jgi:hypothetical protein
MSKISWLEQSMQGLAFWIGYKNQLYRHHKLPEAAIVSEVVSLILAHSSESVKILCEKSYSSLGVTNDNTRADIVIVDQKKPSIVIEVKRYGVNISQDLERLAAVKMAYRDVVCWLLISSQSKIPSNYVDRSTGKAKKGIFSRGKIRYRVVRVWKAAHSFQKMSKANFICLLEIVDTNNKIRQI